MDLLGVVQYAHRTFGNSSAHIPFIPSDLFFNPVTIALLVTLTWPLLYGHAKVEYLFLISRLLQNFWKALLSNCNPLFDTRDSGTLNLVTMFLHTNFLTYTSWILANALASAYLVKLSTATRTNLLFPIARGNGPTMSSPHYAKGHGLLIEFKLPAD